MRFPRAVRKMGASKFEEERRKKSILLKVTLPPRQTNTAASGSSIKGETSFCDVPPDPLTVTLSVITH